MKPYWIYMFGTKITDEVTLYKAPVDEDGTDEEVGAFTLADAGVKENDPFFDSKLDIYIYEHYGIMPEDWEIG